MSWSKMLPMPLPIHLKLHPHHMRMELSAPSKPNLLPSWLERQIDLLRHPLLVWPHPPLPPPKLKSLRWMQFNIPLNNNPEVRRRQRINKKIPITMNNQKIKLTHLLPKSNHNENWNFHVSFVVTITTLETVHIAMKWPNFLKEIRNLLCLPSLFHSNNLWLLKPPL